MEGEHPEISPAEYEQIVAFMKTTDEGLLRKKVPKLDKSDQLFKQTKNLNKGTKIKPSGTPSFPKYPSSNSEINSEFQEQDLMGRGAEYAPRIE